MKSIKNLFKLIKGKVWIYIFAMISVFLANIFSLSVPLVIQYIKKSLHLIAFAVVRKGNAVIILCIS